MLSLLKSTVRSYTRIREGKAEFVPTHTDKRTKKAEVKKLPSLKQLAEKMLETHRVSKLRKPKLLENPVIETKGGEKVAHILQTTKVVKKKRPKGMEAGATVRYKREGLDAYLRHGVLLKETSRSYFVQPKRNAAGETAHVKIDKQKDTIMTLRDYLKKQAPAKPAANIETQGDRTKAHHVLKPSEHITRKNTMEARGIREAAIVMHPSFIGPAILITSLQAQKNGIPTTMHGKKTAAFWNQAENEEYKEMLSLYAVAAMKAWRRELSKPLDKQIKNNIKEFKEVLAGKKHSSYTHYVMETEGRKAVIDYLKERTERRNTHIDKDFGDIVEDPAARHMLDKRSTDPMQLKYTMAVRKETLVDDTKKLIAGFKPVEREALKMKFGFHPYQDMPREGKLPAANEDVAERLNKIGLKDGSNQWTRNSVGKMMSNINAQIKVHPKLADLSFHLDEKLGRPVWKGLEESDEPVTRIPKDLHPEGLFKAGDQEYEVTHEGEEAVLKTGDYRELFKAAEEQMLVKAVVEEVAEFLEKAHIHEHLRHNASGSVSTVREHEDKRAFRGKRGAFYHSETNKRFEYGPTDNPWFKEHGATHEVEVRKNPDGSGGTRGAIVKQTVAHVIIDEDDEGKPVWEKWPLKQHNVWEEHGQ
jgi:hypothetical protein